MKALFEEDQMLDGMYLVEDAGACSCVYVLEGGRTLIDTGNMYGLVDELRDLGPLDRLERIVLTHSHFDHVGGMEEIYQVASPDLYVHPVAREYLRLHRNPFPEFFNALERDGKIKPIKEGDFIYGNPTLTTIHTPGHTAGDLCFFDSRSGALFSGDAVLPYHHRLGAMLSKPDEICGGRTEDKLNSLRRLLAFNVRHLFPGHGQPVFHKGGDQIKMSLYALHQSLNETHPEKAWIAVGEDLLAVGMTQDALQCVAKAIELAPDSNDARGLYEKIASRQVQNQEDRSQ